MFPDMSGFIPGICPIGLAEGLAPGIGIFIPGIFICCGEAAGEGLGDAEGIGMLCMWEVGDGVGDAAGICIPGIVFIEGVGDGEAFGVGVAEGIGIPCLCCARIEVSSSIPTREANTIWGNEVGTIRVSGRVKDVSLAPVSDIYELRRGRDRNRAPEKKKRSDYWSIFFFMSFMLHESPPQQHSCLSEVAPIVV